MLNTDSPPKVKNRYMKRWTKNKSFFKEKNCRKYKMICIP